MKEKTVFVCLNIDKEIYERIKDIEGVDVDNAISRAVKVSVLLVDMFNYISKRDADLAYNAYKSVPLKHRNDVDWFLRDLDS